MNTIHSWVIISLKRGTNTYTYAQPMGRGEIWWKDKLNLELKNRKARPPLCISIDGSVSSSAVSFVCHKQANTKKVFSSLHLFLFLDYWEKKKKTKNLQGENHSTFCSSYTCKLMSHFTRRQHSEKETASAERGGRLGCHVICKELIFPCAVNWIFCLSHPSAHFCFMYRDSPTHDLPHS